MKNSQMPQKGREKLQTLFFYKRIAPPLRYCRAARRRIDHSYPQLPGHWNTVTNIFGYAGHLRAWRFGGAASGSRTTPADCLSRLSPEGSLSGKGDEGVTMLRSSAACFFCVLASCDSTSSVTSHHDSSIPSTGGAASLGGMKDPVGSGGAVATGGTTTSLGGAAGTVAGGTTAAGGTAIGGVIGTGGASSATGGKTVRSQVGPQ
jgi:hypothetical protein